MNEKLSRLNDGFIVKSTLVTWLLDNDGDERDGEESDVDGFGAKIDVEGLVDIVTFSDFNLSRSLARCAGLLSTASAIRVLRMLLCK